MNVFTMPAKIRKGSFGTGALFGSDKSDQSKQIPSATLMARPSQRLCGMPETRSITPQTTVMPADPPANVARESPDTRLLTLPVVFSTFASPAPAASGAPLGRDGPLINDLVLKP